MARWKSPSEIWGRPKVPAQATVVDAASAARVQHQPYVMPVLLCGLAVIIKPSAQADNCSATATCSQRPSANAS
jgi:hypothetical protein